MLLTARAERGPQWDVGTQQYVFPQKRHHTIMKLL